MMELLLLLLPVAAASGWYAAKRSMRRGTELTARQDPAYFKGLNYLLNEQPDQAIDVFVKMLEVDSETVETHLALGKLFRRRGEVDRAIRIHQNLIARPTLNAEHRAQALLELGRDYLRAGLLDRAEHLFNELLESNFYSEQALTYLKIIYQQEKDWAKCLDTAKKLEARTGRSLKLEIAHYYCEQAERARAEGAAHLATNMLKKAKAADENCIRATLLQGAIHADAGEHQAAIKTLKQVEQQDPEYLAEIIPLLLDSFRKSGDGAGMKDYLRELYEARGTVSSMLALADIIQADAGEESAAEFMISHLQAHPSLRGLTRTIDLTIDRAQGKEKELLQVVSALIEQLSSKQPAYQCVRCGFEAKQLHWQCPGCKNWGSVKPLQENGVELSRDNNQQVSHAT